MVKKTKSSNAEAKKLVMEALLGTKAEASYDQIKESLEQLGLNTYESKIYLFIATHLPMSSSQIATELSFERSKIYRVVDMLIQKGLITQTLDNPRLCIVTDCSTAIDGLIHEWEERFTNGKKNKEKIVQFIKNSSLVKVDPEKRNHISVLTSRYSLYSHLVSVLNKFDSNVIIYTNFVDLMRMHYTNIPEKLFAIKQRGNTCTIITDDNPNKLNKNFKGCKIIMIKKKIEGRIIVLEDELVVMSSTLEMKSNHKDNNDINLSIHEPQIVKNMQNFLKMVL